MGDDYVPEEVELVLMLGLLCSHLVSSARPSMWSISSASEARRSITRAIDGRRDRLKGLTSM
ncbi:hypothetical protein Taro_003662 [Colocasia esculenta]|uniref:Uncharacterized protein n=1 Tax=Colocasia esculenta TaxID=4460 RepID=A0A843TMR2_COLES|nr:hypothetical protein [Colocasia esculenta]